jgi:uncharacterized repeat protein (TIGR01451 family)
MKARAARKAASSAVAEGATSSTSPIRSASLAPTGSPFTLKGAAGFGIALDEVEDLLYVGGARPEVLVYSTADWSLVRKISLRRSAISVAVDPMRGYLYTGGGYVEDFYLTQYNLATGVETEVQVAPDGGVMGLGVDPATGFIYATTGRENLSGDDGEDRNDLMVFDTNLVQVQVLENFARDPTGLVIPGKQTSYNPLHLVKIVEQSSGGYVDSGDVREVPIGEEFTYTICFDHNDYALTDITILDTLPQQVTFVRADGDGMFGSYDPNRHAYLWQDPPLSEGARTCLALVAQVKRETQVGTAVINSVMIDTAQTPPTTIAVDAVAAVITEPYKPLNVRKTAIGSSGDANDPTGVVYAKAGENVTYRICYDNRANTRPVNNVTLVDVLPGEVIFLSAGGDIRGQYNALTHTYVWSLPSLSAGESGCVDLLVQVGQDIPETTAITNRVTIDSDETAATTASAVVVAGDQPLRLTKSIKSGAVEDPDVRGRFLVNPGDDITYEICVANPSATRTVTNVSIIDTLPAHTSFVSAEKDREIGYYDAASHTYTWIYGSLAPGAEDCLDLVVHVQEQTEPNTVITNSATVTGKQIPATTAVVNVIVPDQPEPPSGVVEARLFVKPTTLYRNLPRQVTSLMVVVHLPEGLGKELIANTRLTLDPGEIHATSQTIFGTSSMGKVMAFFDPAALLAATQGYGDFRITVSGKLVDGRTFQDKEEIQILRSSAP